MLYLVVHIPHRADEESTLAVSLARQAPIFTMEGIGAEKVASGIFHSLPIGIDLAVELVGETVRLTGAWASINSKRMSSLTRLWQQLDCYRNSLNRSDRERYCRDKTAFFNTLVGCEGQQCPIPCQFMCTPCRHMLQDEFVGDIDHRLAVATELAEVAWCPNLKVPGLGNQVGRGLIAIDPPSTRG